MSIYDIRKSGKPANVVIKLDMEMAYDKVDLRFLINVFESMGFDALFVDKI